ncbi:MAG: hypothetical protein ACYSUB_21230 [Planctomycetota bacterium]
MKKSKFAHGFNGRCDLSGGKLTTSYGSFDDGRSVLGRWLSGTSYIDFH